MTNSTRTEGLTVSLGLPSRLADVLPFTQWPHKDLASTQPYASLAYVSWRLMWPLYLLVAYQILRRIPVWLESLSTRSRSADGSVNGFVVPAVTKHARFLPVESKHAFQYNALYLAVRLDTLESHGLDTGHAFSWKGPHYEPEFVDDAELAHDRHVHPVLATHEDDTAVPSDDKQTWKRRMRAAERVERRRKQEKRRKTGAYTWSLTHLAPRSYLRNDFPDTMSPTRTQWISGSVLLKLAYELRERGYLSAGPQDDQSGGASGTDWHSELGQVWTVTMPALAGITGINPLSVHYCFRPSGWTGSGSGVAHKTRTDDERGPFWLAVLEVHNTFSERHIYVLQAGINEDTAANDANRRAEYDHQWTFPRSFHVSPFNDRGGFYRLFLKHPFSVNNEAGFVLGIRLLLLVQPEVREDGGSKNLVKKLMATLDSPSAATSLARGRKVMPLSAGTLYAALMRQPTDLLTPFVRILWQAGKLHFSKRLDAFGRPDMVQSNEVAPIISDGYAGEGLPPSINHIQLHRRVQGETAGDERGAGAGGLVYPAPSSAELVAKKYIEQFSILRVQQLADRGQHWQLRVVSTNPADTGLNIGTPPAEEGQTCLTLYTRSYGVYSDLCLYTHPRLALLLGSIVGRRWGVSSRPDFDAFFAVDDQQVLTPDAAKSTWADGVRVRHQQWLLNQAFRTGAYTAHEIAELLQSFGIPCVRTKDTVAIAVLRGPKKVKRGRDVVVALWSGYVAARAEQQLFGLLGARYVKGTEPWLELSRGLEYLRHKAARTSDSDGSIDRSAQWDTRLGSVRSSR